MNFRRILGNRFHDALGYLSVQICLNVVDPDLLDVTSQIVENRRRLNAKTAILENEFLQTCVTLSFLLQNSFQYFC